MRYNPPFGSTDPNAPYVDRNTPGAVAGSKVPARALEDTQREIVAAIIANGLTPNPAELTQLAEAIALFATTDRRGRVELATLEETSLGADATRAVTPAGLAPLVTSGSRQTKAFTSSVAVSDINPNTPTVVQTVSISGTRYIDAFGALAFRNSATAANTCQAVMWLRLAGGPQEEYIGCAVPGAAAVQIPLSSRRIFQGLNRNSTYTLQLCALKPVAVGPLNVMDTLIVANHE